MVEIFLIAVSLALDAFAVSVSSGISIPGFGVKQAARMGLWFGAFQFMMPVAGWLLGSSVSQYIETVYHWVAFALLAVIGGSDLTPAALALVYGDEKSCARHGLDWTRAEQAYGDEGDGFGYDEEDGEGDGCSHDHDDFRGFDYSSN